MKRNSLSRTALARELETSRYQVTKHLEAHIKRNPTMSSYIDGNNRLKPLLVELITESVQAGFDSYFGSDTETKTDETVKNFDIIDNGKIKILHSWDVTNSDDKHLKTNFYYQAYDELHIHFKNGEIIEAHQSSLFFKYFYIACQGQFSLSMKSIFSVLQGAEKIRPIDKIAYVTKRINHAQNKHCYEQLPSLEFMPALIAFAAKMNDEPVIKDALSDFIDKDELSSVILRINGNFEVVKTQPFYNLDWYKARQYPFLRIKREHVNEYLILAEIQPNFVGLIHEILGLSLLKGISDHIIDSLFTPF